MIRPDSKEPYLNRPQPSKEVIGKFNFNDTKMRVYIDNEKELKIIEEYLDFELQFFLSSYLNGSTSGNSIVVPIVLSSPRNDGIMGETDYGISNMFGAGWRKEDSMPLEHFMNPGKYPQYFI